MNSILIMPLLFFLACTTAPEAPQVPAAQTSSPPTASIEAKQVAMERGSSHVVEVRFPPGQKNLSAQAQNAIVDVLNKARLAGTIDKAQVISWADEEYPSVHTIELSNAQVNLARTRAEQISALLKAQEVAEIELFNMAKRPGPIKRLFQSDEFRLKRALEVSGIPNTDTSVKRPTKSGHAIVIVYLQSRGEG